MIEDLRKLNDNIIEKNICNKDKAAFVKHNVIKKILKDDKCFFKMSIEQAYAILRELGIPEDRVKDVYSELIDSTNYIKDYRL